MVLTGTTKVKDPINIDGLKAHIANGLSQLRDKKFTVSQKLFGNGA